MFQYSLAGQPISRASSAQYLGVTVTDNLSWNEHINQICKKANSTHGLLCRILSGCDTKVKDTAYRTLVRPKLEYACCACMEPFHQTDHATKNAASRSSRFPNQFNIIRFKSDTRRKTLQYRGPVIWNVLNRLVKVPKTFYSYKQIL